jgi:hypothetical protein
MKKEEERETETERNDANAISWNDKCQIYMRIVIILVIEAVHFRTVIVCLISFVSV